MPFEDWPIISTYSRKQALADGVLIDITADAAQVGFKLPTAVSDALMHRYVMPPSGMLGEGQSLEGRLHDLLYLAFLTARQHQESGRVEFEVVFLMRPGQHEKIRVVLHVGPGDEGEPVLTIMLPGDE